MAIKKISFDQEAREHIRNGVSKLASAVKVTLGPRGRNVIIEKSFGTPFVTKDGVSVAREIELENKYENIGAQLVRQVAAKTSDIAGDGTTTATVLAEAIYEEGLRNVAAGANPVELKRGMETAVAAVVEFLKKNSTPVGDVKEIEQVGTIASNNDSEIGKKLAEAWEQSGGKDGVITIEEGRSLENEIETVEGMQLSGISTIVVTPPAKAARVPVFHPSQWARPGSLKWTWGSMTPGRMAFSPKSCSAG